MKRWRDEGSNQNGKLEYLECLEMRAKGEYQRASDLLEESANLGWAPAQTLLGQFMDCGVWKAQRTQTRIKEWTRLGIVETGRVDPDRVIVDLDKLIGREWVEKAAEQNYPHAVFLMMTEYKLFYKLPAHEVQDKCKEVFDDGDDCLKGVFYEAGVYVNKSLLMAHHCFMKHHEQNPELKDGCTFSIGVCIEHLYRTAIEMQNPFEWYLKAAKDGHHRAQFLYGEDIINRHFPRSWHYKWIVESAKQGYTIAINMLNQPRVFGNPHFTIIKHYNTVSAIYCFLYIKKYTTTVLSVIPLDLIKLVSRIIFLTQSNESWIFY